MITIENMQKQTIKKVLIGVGAAFLLFLISYKTIFNSSISNKISVDYGTDLVLQNKNISVGITKTGAMINNIYLKKYNYIFLNQKENNISKNCFESGWLSSQVQNTPHRNTIWQIKEMTDTKLILTTIIQKREFIKTIILDEDKIIIEDHILNNSSNDIFSYGAFCLTKTYSEPVNFISYTEKKQLIQIPNSSITTNQKQKIGSSNWLGLGDQFFLCFCKTTGNGNVFLKDGAVGENCNHIFFFSNSAQNTNCKKYEIYTLPKDEKILAKYQINNILDYGWFFFITKPLSKVLSFFVNKTNSGIFSLFLLALIIIISNFGLLIMFAKEKAKLFIHNDEKKFIEDNNKDDRDSNLAFFYRKYNIKIFQVLLVPIIISFTWFCLHRAISLSFVLKGKGFFWITDLSVKDPNSILNLYGLLNFNINVIPFSNRIATDVLSIIGSVCFFIHSNSMMAQQGGQKSNPLLLKIIHIFFVLNMSNNLSSGFILSFIIIFIANFFISKTLQSYFIRKYQV